MGRMTSHILLILWKIKHVPNHQPVFKQCLKPPSKSQDSAPAGRGSSIFGLADGLEVQLMQQPRLLDGRDCIVGHLICDAGEGHVHIVALLQGFLQKPLEFRQSIHLAMAMVLGEVQKTHGGSMGDLPLADHGRRHAMAISPGLNGNTMEP